MERYGYGIVYKIDELDKSYRAQVVHKILQLADTNNTKSIFERLTQLPETTLTVVILCANVGPADPTMHMLVPMTYEEAAQRVLDFLLVTPLPTGPLPTDPPPTEEPKNDPSTLRPDRRDGFLRARGGKRMLRGYS